MFSSTHAAAASADISDLLPTARRPSLVSRDSDNLPVYESPVSPAFARDDPEAAMPPPSPPAALSSAQLPPQQQQQRGRVRGVAQQLPVYGKRASTAIKAALTTWSRSARMSVQQGARRMSLVPLKPDMRTTNYASTANNNSSSSSSDGSSSHDSSRRSSIASGGVPAKRIVRHWAVMLLSLGIFIAVCNVFLCILDMMTRLTRPHFSELELRILADVHADMSLINPFSSGSRTKHGFNVFFDLLVLCASVLDLVAAAYGIHLIHSDKQSWHAHLKRLVQWKLAYSVMLLVLVVIWFMTDPLRGLLTLPLMICSAAQFIVMRVTRDYFRAMVAERGVPVFVEPQMVQLELESESESESESEDEELELDDDDELLLLLLLLLSDDDDDDDELSLSLLDDDDDEEEEEEEEELLRLRRLWRRFPLSPSPWRPRLLSLSNRSASDL
ncbi:hypothetical protein RI367_003262 [Sorochytrium milnesiophthora]